MVLDLVDFNERVKPMAKDMALLDKSHAHQRQSVQEAKDAFGIDDKTEPVSDLETTEEVPELERDPSPEEPVSQEDSQEELEDKK